MCSRNLERGIDQLNQENLDPDLPTGESRTAEDVQQDIEAAVEDGASEEEIKKLIKEYEIKVNGKKKRVKIDLNNEEEIKKYIQLAEAGRLSMQEKKELEKLFNQQLMEAKQDPWAFLQELGLDPDQLAESRLEQKIKELEMDPKDRERQQLQKELEAARKELEEQKKQVEEATRQKLMQSASAELEEDLTRALEKHKTLPKTKKTVSRIADAMLWAMEQGYQDVTVDDVIPSVEAEIRAELSSFMSELPIEMMEEYIGKQNIERMRQKRLAKMQKAPSVDNVKPVTKPETEEEKQERKVRNSKDFFRQLRRNN